jgi:peptidoglycan-associated lipoprotein
LIVITARPLTPLPPPPGAEAGPAGLADVLFAHDSSELTPSGLETLLANADWMARHPDARILIEGQADARGSDEYNRSLGLRRAGAARGYLVSIGIAGDRIETGTLGSAAPVCTDDSEACRQRNRRARFVVLPARETDAASSVPDLGVSGTYVIDDEADFVAHSADRPDQRGGELS